MKKNKITIVGLGNIGIEIIKRLSREFEIFCIDLTPEPAGILSTIRKDARFIQGDATSRLVLEEAGVGDSDVVIITTNNEKVNIEVATLLKEHFQVDRIISVGITRQGIEKLEELGIEVESLFMAAVKTFELLSFLGLAGIFLRVLYLIAWWFPEKVERVMENEDPIEEGIRAVFLIALIGSIEAYSVGVEPILGSFLAGIIFNYVFKSKERFEEKINAVGFGFLTPFFFIGVGAEFDIQGLYSLKTVSIAFLLSLLVFVSNLLPVVFSRFMKIKGLESASISLILSAPLTMLLVATTVGVKLGLINEGMKNALILTSIITAILYPFIFRISVKRLTSSSEPAPQS